MLKKRNLWPLVVYKYCPEKRGEYVGESHKKAVSVQRTAGWGARCRQCGYGTGGWGEGARFHAPQHDRRENQPEPVSGKAAGAHRILWLRFLPGVSAESLGQEGRLQQV